MQLPWLSTVCRPVRKEQGVLEGTGMLSLNIVVPRCTVMYRDSFQMRDNTGNIEGGRKVRTVQSLWMKVICLFQSAIITDPSKALYISVAVISPFFRGEGSKRNPLIQFHYNHQPINQAQTCQKHLQLRFRQFQVGNRCSSRQLHGEVSIGNSGEVQGSTCDSVQAQGERKLVMFPGEVQDFFQTH